MNQNTWHSCTACTHLHTHTHTHLHTHTHTSGDAEWKSLAYGVPCIQLARENTEHNSPFHIKLVIAEVESGTTLAIQCNRTPIFGWIAICVSIHMYVFERLEYFSLFFRYFTLGDRVGPG